MTFEDLQLNRVILELRYAEAHLYWDRCGATLLDIQGKFSEWKWERGQEVGFLKNPKRNMELLFDYSNIRFVQNDVENLNQFKEAAEEITPLIVEKLEINKFKRVGNRYLYIFPLENPAEGKKIIQESSLIEMPKEKLALFGEKSAKTAFVVHIENGNSHFRIEIVGVERLAVSKNIKPDEQFNPKYGLRVDVDIATVGDTNASGFDCGKFIQHNKKFLENNLIKFMEE